jgi:predicted double-glycine peptidase
MRTRSGTDSGREWCAGGLAAGSVALFAALLGAARGPEAGVRAVAMWRGARWLEAGPGIRQQRGNDCGPAALAHVLRRAGLAVPFPDGGSGLVPGPAGCRLDEIAAAAARRGVRVRLRRVAREAVDAVEPPAILHLAEGHFVVLEGRGARESVVWDPAFGRIAYGADALADRWSGHALEIDVPDGIGGTGSPSPRKE